MRILVLNSGSSSVKYQVIDTESHEQLAAGRVERLGTDQAHWVQEAPSAGAGPLPAPHNHRAALEQVLEGLATLGLTGSGDGLHGVAHRVVHGGDLFLEATLVDASVIQAIGSLCDLAPLHNPANLLGIEIVAELLPHLPQAAVFDTAFHARLPERAATYALPQSLQRDLRIRRYGFHGSSHAFVARAAATWLQRPLASLRVITLHLGNGASAAAIRDGFSVDTSMGFTPMEGLVMGTRCGDLDASIPLYLAARDGLEPEAIDELLNRNSGLLGMCGVSDMREVLKRQAQGDERADLAVNVFCYRVLKYIGAYLAVLGGADALIFTAGIGEHSPEIRRRCCEGLAGFGIAIDEQRNAQTDGGIRDISIAGSSIRILVIPTDEELEIALAATGPIATASQAPGNGLQTD